MPTAAQTATTTPGRILQLGLGFWAAKTLLSAVELGVFDEIEKKPGSCEELTRRLKVAERSSQDFFDALVALGLLQRNNGVYTNAEDCSQFLVKGKPTYIGGFLEMVNKRLYPFWGELTTALRTGLPQNEAKHGEGNLFEVGYKDPEVLRQFLAAMTGISATVVKSIAAQFPWKNYKTFVDVGTAQGGLAVGVASAHAHLTGIGFDLPAVQPIFEDYVREHKVQDRLKFQPGDFFKDSLPSADVLVMGHILHDWNLAEKEMLVKKAFDALPKGGALVVYDAMIDNDRSSNVFGLLMSLNMLIETPGGFDYTSGDCEMWMKQGGFSRTRAEQLNPTHSMCVGFKD